MQTRFVINFLKKFHLYLDRRILSIFLLGIVQGFPWVMIGSMLTLWLKESGVSRASIGYATLIYSVYALNFLWSPVVESVRLPLFGRLGHRKSWIIACMTVIGISGLYLQQLDGTHDAALIVMICLVIASFSATQDIAIDAYRVDSFLPQESEKVSAAAGVITAGWWTGYAGMGAIPLILSDLNWTWPQLYKVLGALSFMLAIVTVFLPKPTVHHQRKQRSTFQKNLLMVENIKSDSKTLISSLLVVLFSGIIAVLMASMGLTGQWLKSSYQAIFFFSVCITTVTFIILYLSKIHEASPSSLHSHQDSNDFINQIIAWLITALIDPFREFFQRSGVKLALSILAFILLFKLGEAFLGRMSIVFFKEVGFSNTQIATYSKLVTWWLTVFFALASGVLNAKFGIVKGLIVSGIAMASTNLLFSLIALTGPVEHFYALAVVLDGFASAWSTVAFVSFISLLCNQTFSATQYALMASLGNLGRTTVSSSSGQVVDWLNGNWALFFAITSLMVLPSLIILWNIRFKISELIKKAD